MPFGMPKGVAVYGRPWTPMALKAPYFLYFRHKKKTSVDVFRWLFGGAGGI